MQGSWFGLTLGALIALAMLIGLSILASPLLAIIIAVVVVLAIAAVFFARRSSRQAGASPGGSASTGDRSAYEGGPSAQPRSGGAPVSGEGEAGTGVTSRRP